MVHRTQCWLAISWAFRTCRASRILCILSLQAPHTKGFRFGKQFRVGIGECAGISTRHGWNCRPSSSSTPCNCWARGSASRRRC
ncbi:hypothetical protein PR003_g17012 [Phytophthora rubi]|uniref:Secreted protein n=1 Tax=Phytophthora rubi TaxID=129364 RepID=A0A6A4EJ99_9STRA|nr:hypothetical protein PR003_g17012 [Phytophthora rubi]